MSAKMETFFELKKVTDHDCGNYRMGEIDFVNFDNIRDYVKTYGDFGRDELYDVCARVMQTAREQAIRNKLDQDSAQCQMRSVY